MPSTSKPQDTVANAPLCTRTPVPGWKDWLKTGNLAAWFLMKAQEPTYEFRLGDRNQTLDKPEAFGLQHFRVDNLHLDSGETVTAWYREAARDYPTLVYCHGNDTSLGFRADMLREFSDRGFGVIIAAYPGFIGHEKRPRIDPSEEGCNATGYAMVRDLVLRKRIPMKSIVLFGESLGGAVALRTAHIIEKGTPVSGHRLATRDERAPPVICFNTFTSLIKKAEEQFPLLPAATLLLNRFESDKIIGDIDAPVLLMHGKADEFTPCQHSEELARISQASGKHATLKLLDGVNHSAVKPRIAGKRREKDPDQIRKVVDCAHHFMSELGLCPPSTGHSQKPGPDNVVSSIKHRETGYGTTR
jgi:pimeloyl-ACP methyl ester carboxylesterase